MIAGLSGSLLSHVVLERTDDRGGGSEAVSAWRALRGSCGHARDRLGPALGVRAVFDLVAEPLARALGYAPTSRTTTSGRIAASLTVGRTAAAAMIVAPWGESPGQARRASLHEALATGARWSLWINGASLRIWDTRRAYSPRYAEFDFGTLLDDEETFGVAWRLLGAAAVAASGHVSPLERAVAESERYRAEVRAALRSGVHEALLRFISAFRLVASHHHGNRHLLDESLIVVYRILFLLFAEARGLVPRWHPVYREGYTIHALRRQLSGPEGSTGVWEGLQALARLAHRGCRAGSLRVPPFNGRLFSPADAPLAETLCLDDPTVARGLMALTTSAGREISYADLGVEQLGSVYEHLLDFDIAAASRGAPVVLVRTGRRKATGSFYTPRTLTEFLVRRVLAPLVEGASPDTILALRVLDPAMGSGAFLVAACRFLAAAYEHSLILEGSVVPSDLTEADRASFRRAIAQRCLFGVDVNPMAVQLGRLSLWLATLSADRPLTFLDHHLRAGDSLVGASVQDILRARAPGRSRRKSDLPLFAEDLFQSSVQALVGSRLAIADTPDDTLEQVRGKERALMALERSGGPADRWRVAGHLWCAAWYADGMRTVQRGVFRALLDRVLSGAGALPQRTADPLVAQALEIAGRRHFFHWTMEFPEVFYDAGGHALEDPGFDAILGNPPWDMVRGDRGAQLQRETHAFARGSGVYRLQGRGHTNLYHLFVERAIQLLTRGGRAGLVLPAGFATELSSAALRRHLVASAPIDTFVLLENRQGIFPIHRSLKFLLLTFGRGEARRELPLRTGVRTLDVLDDIPDAGADPHALRVPWSIVTRANPETLAIPEIRSITDLEILADVTSRIPALGERGGWHVQFGRELNATDDRPHFREGGDGLPVLEGKHLRPFVVDVAAARRRIPEPVAARLVDAAATFRRDRLAYRDVASATNRTTLIAAIVSRGTITTHTLFCLKTPLPLEAQHFLCGIFNSYVANYLVRMQVGTHVSTGIVARLPVPRVPEGSPPWRRIASMSRSLAAGSAEDVLARLNAAVAWLYGFSVRQFSHVLGTFPLVPSAEREAALDAFRACRG
jgi:hypothetical protein